MCAKNASENSFENLPDWLLKKWQQIADLIAGLLDVKAALIMKTENEFMEVFLSSHSEGNPYHIGDKEKWYGLYCETVIKTQSRLLVPNALKDNLWNKNPDIKLGMIAYLGFPINFPNKQPFGTLCVLDNKERYFSPQEEQLLQQFKNVLELDLALDQSFRIKTDQQAEIIAEQARRAKSLYAISELIVNSGKSLEVSLKSILDLVQSAWSNPDSICVKISFEGQEFLSSNFRDAVWRQSVDIKALNQTIGRIELGHLEGRAGPDAEMFLDEERIFILEVARLIGVMAENVRGELALRENREKFERIYYQSPVGVVRVDKEFHFLECNPAFCSFLGYSEEELRSMTFVDVTYLPDKAVGVAEVKAVLCGEAEVGKVEKRYLRKDGKVVWGDVTIRQVVSLESEQPYLLTIVQDITARKQAQDAARKSAEQFRSVQEVSLEAFTILSAVRDVQGQIIDFEWVYANKAASKILKQPVEKLIGQRLLQVLPGNLENQFLFNRYKQIVENGQGDEVELAYNADGITGWFRNMAIKLEDGVAVSFSDITDRKQAEEKIRQLNANLEQRVFEQTAELRSINANLEKALRSRDEFLAAMSHELRTPLTGVLGLTEGLALQAYGPLTEKQSSILRTIENSGENLLDLINRILDFSTLQSNKLKLDRMPCSLGEICQSVLDDINVDAARKNQQTSFKMEPDIIIFWADGVRLKQILLYLLNNASKFTPEGGSFGVEVKGCQDKKEVEICVWDNGIGIKEEDFPRLFRPFVQLDARLSRAYNGVGLGLALVNSLVELHGGKVAVESTPGAGSRFTVILPWITEWQPPQ